MPWWENRGIAHDRQAACKLFYEMVLTPGSPPPIVRGMGKRSLARMQAENYERAAAYLAEHRESLRNDRRNADRFGGVWVELVADGEKNVREAELDLARMRGHMIARLSMLHDVVCGVER